MTFLDVGGLGKGQMIGVWMMPELDPGPVCLHGWHGLSHRDVAPFLEGTEPHGAVRCLQDSPDHGLMESQRLAGQFKPSHSFLPPMDLEIAKSDATSSAFSSFALTGLTSLMKPG